jgi:hypothetical protein
MGEHRVYVTLYEQHQELALKRSEKRYAGASFVGTETGEGLVEQHQTRLERKRNRDFKLALLAMRKLSGRRRGAGSRFHLCLLKRANLDRRVRPSCTRASVTHKRCEST